MDNLLMQQELKIISLAYKTMLQLAQIGCPCVKNSDRSITLMIYV